MRLSDSAPQEVVQINTCLFRQRTERFADFGIRLLIESVPEFLTFLGRPEDPLRTPANQYSKTASIVSC